MASSAVDEHMARVSALRPSVPVVSDTVGDMIGAPAADVDDGVTGDTLSSLPSDREVIPDDTMSCLIAAISSVELQQICEATTCKVNDVTWLNHHKDEF